MDLKLKGKLWACNIFNRFESICHDADHFMKKDTVQSVGVSVQRLDSDVVEDIHPFSGNIVKRKVQMVHGRRADNQDHVNSVTNFRTKPTGADKKQISENQSSIDTIKKSDASLVMELNHLMQLSRTPSADPSQENESYLRLNGADDGMVSNGTGNSVEVNSTKDLVVVTACTNSSEIASSEIFDQYHKSFKRTMDAAPAFSSCEVGMADCQKDSEQNMDNSPGFLASEIVHFRIKETDSYNSFSEEMEHPSNIFISGCTCTIKSNLAMREHPDSENRNLLAASITSDEKVNECGCAEMDSLLPSNGDVVAGSLGNSDETRNSSAVSMSSGDKVDGSECLLVDPPLPSCSNMDDRASVNSDDNRSLFAVSIISTNKVDENNSMGMDLPLPSTRNAASSCLGTDGTPCYSFSTRDKSSDVSRSFQSSEHPVLYFPDEKQRISVMPSACFMSPKSSDIIKSIRANFMNKPEVVGHHHVEFNDCAYMGKYPIHSEAVSHESKPVDILCALSIPQPNETTPLQIDTSGIVAGSSENRLERYPKNYESNLSVSSKIANAYEYGIGAHDQNMETVDLSSDVKEDQESVILNGTFSHSFSLRRRNFRYYKKLIQDAFTSRKRLTKEYKNLAILYGDINFESIEHSCPSSVPASPNKYAHTAQSQLSQETSETEWELL